MLFQFKTSTVDPNAAYNEVIDSFGQTFSTNWWDTYFRGPSSGTGDPEIIPVPGVSTGGGTVPPRSFEEMEEAFPIDPR